jgi:Na+/melibiose symporter-like transporter
MVTKAGFTGIVAVFFIGLWLVAAPFVLRFQPTGAHWVLATQTSVVVGGLLAVTAFAAFFLTLALHVRALYDSRSS